MDFAASSRTTYRPVSRRHRGNCRTRAVEDSTGFVKHERRQLLEELGGTKILTPTEFLNLARANSLG